MKKAVLIFIVAGLILVSGLFWMSNDSNPISKTEIIQFGVILLLVAFAIFVGIKRLSSARRGELVEDELSKLILLKSASLSYFISLYVWVFMIYLKDRINMDTEVMLGSGILTMAVIFALSWLYFTFKGLKNDQ